MLKSIEFTNAYDGFLLKHHIQVVFTTLILDFLYSRRLVHLKKKVLLRVFKSLWKDHYVHSMGSLNTKLFVHLLLLPHRGVL
jgi:hypothetical protein